MRNKTIIGTFFLSFVLIGMFLLFQSSISAENEGTGKEILDPTCQKKEKDGKMIWENLPSQFFSSF
ncbi:MAG: hypothetical protein ACSLE0_03775 [Chitinophagaceae bacterium]